MCEAGTDILQASALRLPLLLLVKLPQVCAELALSYDLHWKLAKSDEREVTEICVRLMCVIPSFAGAPILSSPHLQAFSLVLEAIGPMVYSEEEFIADFLQINDAALTFADYMGLENYFRRQAARSAGLSSNTLKLVRGAMDLIFGFLSGELKSWLDAALAKDSL